MINLKESLEALEKPEFRDVLKAEIMRLDAIDIPLFIREISTDNPLGAAETIFEQNILGGMCARVCPTEVLCEQACVRNTQEDKPVEIGLLQRHATDAYFAAPGAPMRLPATNPATTQTAFSQLPRMSLSSSMPS